jgi:hypothetical protein
MELAVIERWPDYTDNQLAALERWPGLNQLVVIERWPDYTVYPVAWTSSVSWMAVMERWLDYTITSWYWRGGPVTPLEAGHMQVEILNFNKPPPTCSQKMKYHQTVQTC